MTARIFSRAARARTSARARVTLRQKFFIAFLDELDNSKHFEPYFFFGKFSASAASGGLTSLSDLHGGQKIFLWKNLGKVHPPDSH